MNVFRMEAKNRFVMFFTGRGQYAKISLSYLNKKAVGR